MSETQTPIDCKIHEVAEQIRAEAGDAGYFRGIVNHAPFLMKTTSVVPAGLMVKLRRGGERRAVPPSLSRGHPSQWHRQLSDEYSEAEVRCEIEDDYVFIWIDKPNELSGEMIASLIAAYVLEHPQYFPDSDHFCFDCRQTGAASPGSGIECHYDNLPRLLEPKTSGNRSEESKAKRLGWPHFGLASHRSLGGLRFGRCMIGSSESPTPIELWFL